MSEDRKKIAGIEGGLERPDRREFLKKAGLAGGAIAAGWTTGLFTSTRGWAADPIKIGYISSLSGNYAYLGENELMGAQLIAEELNQKGGVLGRQVELLVEDTGCNAGVGVQKVTKLIEKNNVDVVVGELCSSVVLAVGDLVQQRKKIYIATGPNSAEITGTKCHRYVFRIDFSNEQMGNTHIPWLFKNRGKKWYFITSDYAWGHDCYRIGSALLKKEGGSDLGNDNVPLAATDYSAYILKIKAANPELVFCSLGGMQLINFLKQFKEFGLRGKIEITGATINHSDSWNMGVETMTGVWPTIWYYKLKAKGSPEFTQRYVKKFNKAPENGSWHSYVGIKVLAEVIEKTKSLDSPTLVKALEGYKFDALKGRECYFREWDHQLMQPIYIVRVKEKKEMEDEWDHFQVLEELPGPDKPLDSIAGTKEEVGCKLDDY